MPKNLEMAKIKMAMKNLW